MIMRNQNLLHVAAADIDALAAEMRHRLTTCSGRGRSGLSRPAGVTVWATESGSAMVHWTWVVGDDGYPVLGDPWGLRSNLLFYRPGQRASYEDQLTSINWLVYRLPWQEEVCKRLAPRRPVVGGGVGRGSETRRREPPPARQAVKAPEHAIAA